MGELRGQSVARAALARSWSPSVQVVLAVLSAFFLCLFLLRLSLATRKVICLGKEM